MSLNIVAAWPGAIVCVSDRRLTDFATGKVLTNRSTKMVLFSCSDAHGAIVYNGIGWDDTHHTPCDWILELESSKKLFENRLDEVIEAMRADLETRLRAFRARYGPKHARHTFVVAAWHEGGSTIYGVSNYERVDSDETKLKGSECVEVSVVPPTRAPIRIVATGVSPQQADIRAVSSSIREYRPIERVVGLCVRTIRNVAYGKGRGRGPVGAAAQWAVLTPDLNEVWCGLDVVDGAAALEDPVLINIAAKSRLVGTWSVSIGGPGIFKDVIVGTGDQGLEKLGKYDQGTKAFAFSEPKCGICGTPWPATHRSCETCMFETHRAKSRKARRSRWVGPAR